MRSSPGLYGKRNRFFNGIAEFEVFCFSKLTLRSNDTYPASISNWSLKRTRIVHLHVEGMSIVSGSNKPLALHLDPFGVYAEIAGAVEAW